MNAKFLSVAFLLLGISMSNAQQVQTSVSTGLGNSNGAFTQPATLYTVTVGTQAGTSTTGQGNTIIGHDAGFVSSSGTFNSYLGLNTGKQSTGSYNAFTGALSGFNTTGSNNTFTGYGSGTDYNFVTKPTPSNNTGNNNSFYGYYSGSKNTSGSNNAFYGYNSGSKNTTAGGNSFFGYQSGLNNSTGGNNSFFGTSAGLLTTTGTNNVYIGASSGSNTGNFSSNTAVGFSSGIAGNQNTSIGLNSGFDASGSNNTYLGVFSGGEAIGSDNTYLGHSAGSSSSGSRNVFIGISAGQERLGNDKLYIANSEATALIYGDFSTGKVSIGQIFNYATADKFPATAGGVPVGNYKLFVKGGILTEEIRVSLSTGTNWADYVFADDYELKTLSEVEQFIKDKGHLPNVPSATQVKEDGIELSHMAKIQQEKIEELTLYAIAQDKQLNAQKLQLEQQQKEIDELKAAVKALVQKQ